jgi:predicted O-methyltransferase YrrM
MDNLAKDGILICDNVLQEGNVAQSRYALTRRDHTVHARMRQFLYELKHDERFRVVILPVGDGVALVQNKR